MEQPTNKRKIPKNKQINTNSMGIHKPNSSIRTKLRNTNNLLGDNANIPNNNGKQLQQMEE